MKRNALRQAMSQTIHIADDEWEAFEPYIALRKVKKRDFFLQEGQTPSFMGFVLSGSLRQYYIIDGEEKTTYFYFESDFVGDYDSFLTQRPCDHSIEAMEDCEILTFERDTMHRLYRLYPKFETFGRLIAEGVYLCVKERLMHFLLNTHEERYRHFMQSHEAEKILQRVPQHYVASYLGITPVSLSRIRARVAKEKKELTIVLQK